MQLELDPDRPSPSSPAVIVQPPLGSVGTSHHGGEPPLPAGTLLRERAAVYESWTDAEVLAELLGPVEQLRLPSGQSLRGLLELPLTALARLLSPAAIDRLAVAIDVLRRLTRADMVRGDLLSHPEAVVRYLALRYGRPTQELMGAVFVDVRNRHLGDRELYLGTLSRAAVEPRAIFEHALALGAAGFLLFHNHPSADPSPSAEDLVFTRRIADAGEVLGIRLLDHLVIADAGRWVSLRRLGGW